MQPSNSKPAECAKDCTRVMCQGRCPDGPWCKREAAPRSSVQPYSLLAQQKKAAERSAYCHFLARLRIAQGYLGAALFYQQEAARMHRKACELREQYEAEQAEIVTEPRTGAKYRITRYNPPENPVNIDWSSAHGSKELAPWRIINLSTDA